MFGKLASIRTKLGLSEMEMMNSCWISLQIQMMDFPYYDHKATTGNKKNGNWLDKYKNRYKK